MISRLGPVWQWTAMLGLSAACTFAIDQASIPAAFLIGSMLPAIALGANGATIRVPAPVYYAVQGLLGCLVARGMTPSILAFVLHHWPIVLLVIATTMLASTLVAWLLVRFGSMPGTTAAWGSSPGAAGTMTLMSEQFGADSRLVALMQYIRVVCVVLTASLVSHLWGLHLAGTSPGLAAPAASLPPGRPWEFMGTMAIAATGPVAGLRLRFPGGASLIPLLIGTALQTTGVMRMDLPPWVLIATYALLGWQVGLRFNRHILMHAFRTLRQMLFSCLANVILAGLSAWLLAWLLDIDGLTAYLATSPGGLDSIAVISVSVNADVPMIMALQTFRFFVVILAGPWLARAVCWLAARQSARER